MPKKVSDYSQSTVYKICCNDTTLSDIYVGSTTSFSKQKSSHKSKCNTTTSKGHNVYVYQFIREHGGWENWSMIEVEKYNATSKRNLEARERHWLETLGATLNKNIPYRTVKEWRETEKKRQKQWRDDNKEKRRQYDKKYRADNREELLIREKKYRDENKEKRRQYDKKYRADNREELSKREKNTEHIIEKNC